MCLGLDAIARVMLVCAGTPASCASTWRAEAGTTATETQVLVMALLLAGRAPEKKLDKFISSLLMEEDNFEQAGGCNWAPPSKGCWNSQGLMHRLVAYSLSQEADVLGAMAVVLHKGESAGQ
eukprot:2349531-Pleurochrysis_carterae.AAC.1